MKIKNQFFNHVFLALGLLLLAACKSSYDSLLIADEYSEKKDMTTLTMLPYGSIEIPGKWDKVYYNESSRQHYFKNSDSVGIAITKNPMKNYPFFEEGMKAKDFSKAWYTWEEEHYSSKGIQIEQLKSNEEAGYVIWKATAERTNNIFLYGVKKNMAYNLGSVDDRWPEEERIAFLEALWKKN